MSVGYPNLKFVKNLIYKCGYGKINRHITALTNNSVKHYLGNYDIICVKDLIYEICQLDLNLSRPTNICGHFSSMLCWVGQRKKETTMSNEKILETVVMLFLFSIIFFFGYVTLHNGIYTYHSPYTSFSIRVMLISTMSLR